MIHTSAMRFASHRYRRPAIGGLCLVMAAACAVTGCGTSVRDGPGSVSALEARALEGQTASQLELARLYEEGRIVPRDLAASLRWYVAAADGGSAEGALGAAEILLGRDGTQAERERAMELLDRAAAAGLAPAQSRRADLHLSEGVVEDEDAPRRARELYTAAAEQGFVDAQYKLGAMLATGRGGARDLARASEWFRRAAEQGDARAQLSLGDLYLAGVGVSESVFDALDWYRRSAEQGAYRAQSNLGDLLTLERYGSVRDVVAGADWYRRAAEQGYARAQSRLGTLLANGIGVERDFAAAASWFRAAAEQGYAPAQCHLGSLYYRGAGVEQDLDAAERWFGLAAAQAPAGIVPLLGFVYYDCREFEPDAIDLTVAVPG